MNHPDYNSPAALKNFLEENGMAMQKKFGQNFMVNPTARTNILKDLDLSENDHIWEVGPGLGCMTEEILQSGASLTVFEIDRGFIGFLKQFFESYAEKDKFRIIEGDVLKNWKKQYDSIEDQNLKNNIKLSGNLPYNIAATFIADTITSGMTFERCVFTVQKEVTERICAKPSSENYSSFSVLCQYAYDVKSGIVLAAGNFWPKPNVDSQSVILKRKAEPYTCSDPKFFVKLVHALFSQRRKTISNNIKTILPKEKMDIVFEESGIAKNERAENLSVKQFVDLAEICLKHLGK